jgi:hypothetical protein
VKILKTVNHEQTRKTMYQLFYINIIIILMDLGLLGVEYAKLYILETSIKGVVYSVKLKLEFAILGRLVQYVTHGSNEPPTIHTPDVPDFVDVSRVSSNATHAQVKPTKPSRPIWPQIDNNSDAIFEHVERRSQDSRELKIHTANIVSIKGPGSNTSGSEEDIEKMMRKYSVRGGLK